MSTGEALLVCDNRDVPNWGCRATSIALHDLLRERFGISGTVSRGDTIHRESRYPLIAHLPGKLRRKLAGRSDYISGDIAHTADTVIREARSVPFFRDLIDKVTVASMVVVNGEGSMVFKPAERRDLRFQLLCIELATRFDKPAFYVNAMISDFPDHPRPAGTWTKVRASLAQCRAVQVRDPESLALLEQMAIGRPIATRPDALFSWIGTRFFPDVHPRDLPAPFLAPHPETEDRIGWSFERPYVCVSGSSYFRARERFDEAEDFHVRLAEMIRAQGRDCVFVATCTGDAFLERAAEKAGVPFIPVGTNIFAGAAILANADCFISGRYHPSILASLGGTPCIFFESNSHKMHSLQAWLGSDRAELSYRQVDVIGDVRTRLGRILEEGGALRSRLVARVGELAVQARTIPDFIESGLRG